MTEVEQHKLAMSASSVVMISIAAHCTRDGE